MAATRAMTRVPPPPLELTYRAAAPCDIEAMFDMRGRTRENALSRETLRALGITPASIDELLRDGRGLGWVSLQDGELVGFSLGDPASGEILVLAVLPAFEGRGVGKTLLDAVSQALRAAGCGRLFLATSPDPQTRSHGFYRALGWRPTGTRVESGDEILEHLAD